MIKKSKELAINTDDQQIGKQKRKNKGRGNSLEPKKIETSSQYCLEENLKGFLDFSIVRHYHICDNSANCQALYSLNICRDDIYAKKVFNSSYRRPSLR